MSQTAGNQNLIPAVLDCSLSSSQTCNGNAEGAAGDVVQADLVAELNGDGVAAVLAADAVVQTSAGSLALGNSHLDRKSVV